ncbi:hypothetical protein [Methylobacterium sp. Leaf456]|uniref:hypothetical protein n=1 Tax=Methylobacterium sp. Leaf456 TaxID=1736382 RepID=UPI000B246C2C|nr:hypothetical protein [Methylobacterium sp. Leaf456]
MAVLVSLTCLLVGAALSVQAGRYPAWTARMETAGGVALVAGLAVIGVGLNISV